MIDVIVIIYLDDILIYSNNIPSHRIHGEEVLWRLTLTDFLPMQKCNSMSLPANTLDICCHWKPHHGPIQSPDHKLGQYHKKSRIFQLSLACQLLLSLHLWIFWNHSSTYAILPSRVPPCISLMSSLHFEALKKAFTTAPVLTHWILDTQIIVKTAPLTMHSHVSFPSWLPMWIAPHCIPLPDIFALELNYMSTMKS